MIPTHRTATHPGKILLKEFLEPLELTQKALAKHVENVQVWYSPKDKWTGIAKYIPFSPWGAQGRKGYTGKKDNRYTQFNEDELFQNMKDKHSGIWQSDKTRQYFVEEVLKLIKESNNA